MKTFWKNYKEAWETQPRQGVVIHIGLIILVGYISHWLFYTIK